MDYFYHVMVLITVYIMLGLSLNLVVGYLGLLAICQGAFFGVGAYTCALLMVEGGMGFIPSLVCAVLANVVLSFAVGWPALRVRGDFFVLATMGFQIILFSLLYNLTITRGPFGIRGIPPPSIRGWTPVSPGEFLLLTGSLAVLVGALVWQLSRAPFGRLLMAVREDEVAATALGKDALQAKTTAFVLSGALAAVAGACYATYISYIDPTSFDLNESVFILSIVVIGGAGSIRGPVIGAVVIVTLPELLRFIDVPDSIASNLRQVIYGGVLIATMRLRPQGILGRYAFD